MQAILLNGAASPSDPTSALCTEVAQQLSAQFETVRTFHLAGFDVGHCLGEFDCFIKTPGRCRIHDEGQEIERAAHDADLLVLLTPLRYGGYAPHLKKAVDRLLPLISPFLRKVAGMRCRPAWFASAVLAVSVCPELMEIAMNDTNPRAATLQALIQAATLAPSSHNTQPWLFRLKGSMVELLAVLSTVGDTPGDSLAAGQALQHLLLEGVHQGLQASYLNQPAQVTTLRPRLQLLTGSPGWAQLLLRIGVPAKTLPAAPRRPGSDVLVAA